MRVHSKLTASPGTRITMVEEAEGETGEECGVEIG